MHYNYCILMRLVSGLLVLCCLINWLITTNAYELSTTVQCNNTICIKPNSITLSASNQASTCQWTIYVPSTKFDAPTLTRTICGSQNLKDDASTPLWDMLYHSLASILARWIRVPIFRCLGSPVLKIGRRSRKWVVLGVVLSHSRSPKMTPLDTLQVTSC